MKKLILIDGNAIIHRAFHALPDLTKGEKPVNAVYGFFLMFLRIINDIKPDYIVVCFDKKAPTFRKNLYVGYQAKRPKMVEGLSSQIILLHDALEKAKVEIFETDGYEADDLIGTISKQASEKDIKVIIVTGDRDMLQLVNEKVNVLAPIVGVTKMILFDEEKVKEKYGLNPSQIIDYKALVGDQSDNYPGVTGIGPKTARDLLLEYENFENLYKNISLLPEKISIKLALDAEAASLAKKLATIVTDAPINFKMEKASVSNFDSKSLVQFFKKVGFKSLIERIPNSDSGQNINQPKKKNKSNDEQLGLL